MHSKVSLLLWTATVVLTGVFLWWIFIFLPNIPYLPKDFTFSAKVFSIDNLYDETENFYTGESISNTRFEYTVLGEKDGVLEIENVFDVRRPNGEQIISITRRYGIDNRTGRHVFGYGDQNRNGYLFGPRNASQDPFVYWHINYNQPLKMQFVQEEDLLGLRVNKYKATFNVDQTKELDSLPEVGETRGILVQGELYLWIEPQTGLEVKYQDSAVASYYNLETGEIQSPWNKFSNTTRFPSVVDNITQIQQILNWRFAYHNVVPGLLLVLIGICLFLIFVRKKNNKSYIALIPFLILLGGIMTSILLYQAAIRLDRTEALRTFETDTESITTIISERMEVYANGLIAAKGLFLSSDDVSREEFYNFINSLDFEKNYSGVQGFGYSIFIPKEELAEHEENIRKQGVPDYKVYPEQERDIYTSILYISPLDKRNLRAVGYDMYSNPIRREAMDRAIRTGDVALTAKVTLVQEDQTKPFSGMLMYLPLYKDNYYPLTESERVASASGFVYGAFRAPDLFGRTLQNQLFSFDITIYDGDGVNPDNKLFNSSEHFQIDFDPNKSEFTRIKKLPMYGRTWTIEYKSLPGYAAVGYEQQIILVFGIILSFALAMYTAFLIRSRQEAIDMVKKTTGDVRKLRKAVDDSLSSTIITDIDGHIIYANQAAQKITGYSFEEMKGKTPRLWKSDKTDSKVYTDLWKTIKYDHKAFSCEFVNKRKNGEYYSVAATISPIIEDGELTGFIGTEEDITNRVIKQADLEKQKEELERVNKILVERELKMIELKKEIQQLKDSKAV